MNISLGNLFTEDLAVDLGTVHTFVYARGRGMVVNEPSLVAIDRVTNQVIAVGTEALEMLGRSPEDVEIAYPMQSGVVADSNRGRDGDGGASASHHGADGRADQWGAEHQAREEPHHAAAQDVGHGRERF